MSDSDCSACPDIWKKYSFIPLEHLKNDDAEAIKQIKNWNDGICQKLSITVDLFQHDKPRVLDLVLDSFYAPGFSLYFIAGPGIQTCTKEVFRVLLRHAVCDAAEDEKTGCGRFRRMFRNESDDEKHYKLCLPPENLQFPVIDDDWDGLWLSIALSVLTSRLDVLGDLLSENKARVPSAQDTLNIVSYVYRHKTPICLIVLREDGRFNFNDLGAETLLSCCKRFELCPDFAPSQHHLHELLKGGCDPNRRLLDGSQPIDHCTTAESSAARKLLQSYMDGKPIEQRMVEMTEVDDEGRTIQYRFYADDHDETPLDRLSQVFKSKANRHRFAELDCKCILGDGTTRPTLTIAFRHTETATGWFLSRVLPSMPPALTSLCTCVSFASEINQVLVACGGNCDQLTVIPSHLIENDDADAIAEIEHWKCGITDQSFALKLITDNKPRVLDLVLSNTTHNLGIEFFMSDLIPKCTAQIIRVVLRHAIKDKSTWKVFKLCQPPDNRDNFFIDENSDGLWLSIALVVLACRHDVLSDLLFENKTRTPTPQNTRNIVSAVYRLPSLSICLIILREDGRFNFNDLGAETLLSCCKRFHIGPQVGAPSLHFLSELLKGGCDPNRRLLDGTLPIDHCKTKKASAARKLLQSYMDGKPIEQRMVEMTEVDDEGRTIQYRFYADEHDRTPIDRLPQVFRTYRKLLTLDCKCILSNGRTNFSYKRPVHNKLKPNGVFLSRVIPPMPLTVAIYKPCGCADSVRRVKPPRARPPPRTDKHTRHARRRAAAQSTAKSSSATMTDSSVSAASTEREPLSPSMDLARKPVPKSDLFAHPCIVCESAKATFMIRPCNHLALCAACHEETLAKKKKAFCPFCNERTKKYLRVRY